ncbi:hypothetical protein COCNU_03G010580 [Cocos nucifera]|uniref:Uncharacterized protein n=1 Tax=Cocos nucifera TaxID=13894 RepID=A0A8K0I3L5_COCNU|nr:hypothetical protein COCNU_03G010580 [Cocos nucifera]
MDSPENGKEKPREETAKVTENPTKEEKEKEKEKVVEEETVTIPVSREAEDVSVELVQSKKEEVGGGGGSTEVAEEKTAAVAAVVPVHEPVSVTQEVIAATEAAAVTSEALAQESEAKPVPIFDTPPAPVVEVPSQPRESERSETNVQKDRQESFHRAVLRASVRIFAPELLDLLLLKMAGLLIAVFCAFALVICVSLELFDDWRRQMFVGYLSVASLISMFASPLFIMLKNFILLLQLKDNDKLKCIQSRS